MSIITLLATHFSTGAARLIGWIVLQFFAAIYLSRIFGWDYVRKFDGRTHLQYIVRYSPYMSAAIVISWVIYTVYTDGFSSEFSVLIAGSMVEKMGAIFGIAAAHFIYLMIIILPVIVLDRVLGRKNRTSQEDSSN